MPLERGERCGKMRAQITSFKFPHKYRQTVFPFLCRSPPAFSHSLKQKKNEQRKVFMSFSRSFSVRLLAVRLHTYNYESSFIYSTFSAIKTRDITNAHMPCMTHTARGRNFIFPLMKTYFG